VFSVFVGGAFIFQPILLTFSSLSYHFIKYNFFTP